VRQHLQGVDEAAVLAFHIIEEVLCRKDQAIGIGPAVRTIPVLNIFRFNLAAPAIQNSLELLLFLDAQSVERIGRSNGAFRFITGQPRQHLHQEEHEIRRQVHRPEDRFFNYSS
jgi:hypothetical protein